MRGAWEDRCVEGVFLGWVLTGGAWTGQYLIAPLMEFHALTHYTGEDYHRFRTVKVTNIHWRPHGLDKEPEFPIRDYIAGGIWKFGATSTQGRRREGLEEATSR